MATMAPTPVLPEASLVGALSAQLRRPAPGSAMSAKRQLQPSRERRQWPSVTQGWAVGAEGRTHHLMASPALNPVFETSESFGRDAVTPTAEALRNWRGLGALRCTCRISWTVSTGSSPSTRSPLRDGRVRETCFRWRSARPDPCGLRSGRPRRRVCTHWRARQPRSLLSQPKYRRLLVDDVLPSSGRPVVSSSR